MYNLLINYKLLLQRQDIIVDNAIFRLHYQLTTVLLLVFSAIITASQYVGSPIECMNDNSIPTYVINTYCWITSTFSMPDAFRREVGREVPHPGVGPMDEFQPAKYYTYYQWVVFVLFFQAILCYIPKWLWSIWEGGLLETLVMDLNIGTIHEEEKKSKQKVLIDYMLKHIKRHNGYAIRYYLCEVLCLVNIVGQMYLMNTFFDNEFMSYGLKVLEFAKQEQDNRVDPMIYIFPRVTKCTFHSFGPSGTIQVHDSLCILPLNIINEKSFIFLWFWYIIMATLLSGLIVYRLVILSTPVIRPTLLHWRCAVVSKDRAKEVVEKVSLGDWWVLYMLARNIDHMAYKEIISELSNRIATEDSNK